MAVPVSAHGNRADRLVLVVIRPVAQGEALLHDLSPELALYEVDAWLNRRKLLLEDSAHVVQEPGGAGQEGRPLPIVHVVQEILGVLVALLCRQREPANSGFPVLRDILSQQIQLAE